MPLINPDKNPERVFITDGMPAQFTNPDLTYKGPAPYERPIKLDGNDFAGFLILFGMMVVLVWVKVGPKVRKAWGGSSKAEKVAPVTRDVESSASGEQKAHCSEGHQVSHEKRKEKERLGIVFSVDGVDENNVELFAKIFRVAGLVVSAFVILFLYGAFSRYAPIDTITNSMTYSRSGREATGYFILFLLSVFGVYFRFHIGAFFISSVILLFSFCTRFLRFLFRVI
jgi:hypothetical protein